MEPVASPSAWRWLVVVLGLCPTAALTALLGPLAGFAGFSDARYIPVAGLLWLEVITLLPAEIHLTANVMNGRFPWRVSRRAALLWCAAGLAGILSGFGQLLLWPVRMGADRWGGALLLILPALAGFVLLAGAGKRLRLDRARRDS